MTWTMGDISNPGTLKVQENAVAFYIGGNTPWTWTPAQVDSQVAQLRLPIWTWGLNTGETGGIIEAVRAGDAMAKLGIPKDVACVIDMESHTDPDYVNAFESVLAKAGYKTMVYGSLDTIETNPLPSGGRWVAHWTGTPHFTGIPGEVACQWQKAGGPGNDKPWDISLVGNITAFWDVYTVKALEGVLVVLPGGVTKYVKSINGGVTWT